MEPQSLYYYFSTTAQVLAAIAALLAIFTQFKINEIKDFLIGDGQAVYQRMGLKEDGYDLPHGYNKYYKRLRDAVGRKSIFGILEVIEILANYEMELGRNLKTNPTGLNFIKNHINSRISQIRLIKKITKKAVIISSIAIEISLMSLIFVKFIAVMDIIAWILVIITLTLTFVSILITISGIYKGLEEIEKF